MLSALTYAAGITVATAQYRQRALSLRTPPVAAGRLLGFPLFVAVPPHPSNLSSYQFVGVMCPDQAHAPQRTGVKQLESVG